MRDGHVDLQKYSEDVEEIQKEAEYYLLGGLVELCKPKPEAQKMPYFAETDEDMVRTVASSTKKVLCTVFVGTQSRNVYLESFIKVVMLYGDKVDFCFRERAGESTRFIIHNKKTHQFFEEYSHFGFDINFIQKHIPNIDDY